MTRVVNLKHEDYDIYIGRPSEYGNPFQSGRDGTRKEVIQKYRKWVYSQPDLVEKIRKELKGKRLGCFCKPLSCHGDVLVEIAESTISDLFL